MTNKTRKVYFIYVKTTYNKNREKTSDINDFERKKL